jgi:hypothetical protein
VNAGLSSAHINLQNSPSDPLPACLLAIAKTTLVTNVFIYHLVECTLQDMLSSMKTIFHSQLHHHTESPLLLKHLRLYRFLVFSPYLLKILHPIQIHQVLHLQIHPLLHLHEQLPLLLQIFKPLFLLALPQTLS